MHYWNLGALFCLLIITRKVQNIDLLEGESKYVSHSSKILFYTVQFIRWFGKEEKETVS